MTRAFKTKTDCKWGTFSYYEDDLAIGQMIEMYGEYSDYEVEAFKKIVKEGDVVLELGANIGAHTVPLAKLVGDTGQVFAFEPGHDTYAMLHRNVNQNHLAHIVRVMGVAALDRVVSNVPVVLECPTPNYPKLDYNDNPHAKDLKATATCNGITIDSLDLPRVDFVKIDIDGTELAAIRGMRETIKRCRPILMIENEIKDKAGPLVAEIVELGYRGWSYRPPLYRADNHAGNPKNLWPGIVSLMEIYIPEELDKEVKGCDEVMDIRHWDPEDDQIHARELKRYLNLSNMWPKDLGVRLIATHFAMLEREHKLADSLFEQNLAIDPTHKLTQFTRAYYQLQRGEYKEGWKNYELRYELPGKEQFGGDRMPEHLIKWDGRRTYDPLTIMCEQGYGDTIMFARYVKYAMERAPNLCLEVQSELYELFDQSNVVPAGRLVRLNRSLPYDKGYYISIPSLPAALGDDGSLMRIDGPYLFADPYLTNLWREKRLKGARIGLCWEGSPRSERAYTRNVNPKLMIDLEKEFGPFYPLNDWGHFDSYASTAAAIMALDLVITVDTSVAHLAGALGQEVWLMCPYDPDFRWGLEGTTCPWYPTMRMFRQPKVRDWKSVIEQVRIALGERMQQNAA